ncbi:MAG: 4-hydroxy-tetrahydrodipicolinate reductase [Hydrogenophilus sp.]|nr:4-hydroxy-tetrahydrodipicolinate reductase [Hydrogenophilus sp.]
MTLRVGVTGATGRMGQMVIEAILAPESGMTLASAWDRFDSPAIGHDAGACCGKRSGCVVTAEIEAAVAAAECMIDFSRPEASLVLLAEAVRQRRPLVIGTTGFDTEGRRAIESAAQTIPIVFSPNMAVGVNAVFYLLEVATRLLADFDVEIIEAHHRFKVDAPSGTALEMGRIIAAARGWLLAEVATFERHGETGVRPTASIGFSAVRGGDIVGDHTVLFAGRGERIEITHRAQSRMPYALGALAAARFVVDQKAGLYTMRDVLAIKKG